MNILLLGPQGSGKGTQAKRIAAEYGLAHIATGDMLREAMAAETPLGLLVKPIYDAGELVPDDLMIDLIRARVVQDDALQGFILDGFPRTMPQADALDDMLKDVGRELTLVFELQVPKEVCVARMLKRAAEEGRTDDSPEVIRTRLARFYQETEPLVEHYRVAGKVVGIQGDRPVNDVFADIQSVLETVAVR